MGLERRWERVGEGLGKAWGMGWRGVGEGLGTAWLHILEKPRLKIPVTYPRLVLFGSDLIASKRSSHKCSF